MTASPLAALSRLRAEKARREKLRRAAVSSLAAFVKQAWHVIEPGTELEWNWHHDALCSHVQAMIEDWARAGTDAKFRQRCQNLAINVGPISLKSKIIMVCAPAWVWLRWPSWTVLCASGTPSNVDRDSMACRDLVMSSWYRNAFNITWATVDVQFEIRGDLDRVSKWGTTAGGMRESRGMGGSFTGVHVDAMFIDDPDDAAKVWSDAARRDTWATLQAMGNRLNDIKRPVRLVVQQNLHEEDATSRLIETGWQRLMIPLEYDPSRAAKSFLGWRDPRKRPGELLHAQRFPAEVIEAERLRLGSQGFEAQYNCNPSPLDGGMIKRAWFRFFRLEDMPASVRRRPDGCTSDPAITVKRAELKWLTVTIDCSNGSESSTASAVGLLVVGGRGQERFVIDDRTAVMGILQMYAAIKACVGAWRPQRVLIELKAAGSSVIADLKQALAKGDVVDMDGRPVSVVVEAVTDVRDSKEGRAQAMVPAIEAGLVYLLDGAAWLHPKPGDPGFVAELCTFPNGKRDDRVDALSQLMTYYRAKSVSIPRGGARHTA